MRKLLTGCGILAICAALALLPLHSQQTNYTPPNRCAEATTALISGTGAATAKLVTGVANQKIRLCFVAFSNMNATGSNVKLVEGTGTNCGTGQTQLTGQVTLSPNTAAGNHTEWAPPGPFTANVNGDDICVTGSAAGSVDTTTIYTIY